MKDYQSFKGYLISKILKISYKNNNSGFSLVELLLGVSLTSFILSMSWFGLIYIMSEDRKAAAKADIQYNTNRSIEFITEEIRSSYKVESDAVKALSEAPSFILPNGAKPVIIMQVYNVPQRIIYYTEPASGVWLGPNVVKRWGPSFNDQGEYETTEINNPGSWKSHVLVDNIDNTDTVSNCLPNWKRSNLDSVQGFNACVDPQERLVKFNMTTVSNNITWKKKISYEVETVAFVRGNEMQGFTENETAFTIVDNRLVLNKSSQIKFEILGGQITCGAGGVDIPVTTNIYINDVQHAWDSSSSLTLPNQSVGTTFDIESIAGNGSICNGFTMGFSSNDFSTSQVEVLVDGSLVPDILPFHDQNEIEFFLQKYVVDGKIKLADNQVIYLFELGTTNKNSSAFDLQDNVVLGIVEPNK